MHGRAKLNPSERYEGLIIPAANSKWKQILFRWTWSIIWAQLCVRRQAHGINLVWLAATLWSEVLHRSNNVWRFLQVYRVCIYIQYIYIYIIYLYFVRHYQSVDWRHLIILASINVELMGFQAIKLWDTKRRCSSSLFFLPSLGGNRRQEILNV